MGPRIWSMFGSTKLSSVFWIRIWNAVTFTGRPSRRLRRMWLWHFLSNCRFRQNWRGLLKMTTIPLFCTCSSFSISWTANQIARRIASWDSRFHTWWSIHRTRLPKRSGSGRMRMKPSEIIFHSGVFRSLNRSSRNAAPEPKRCSLSSQYCSILRADCWKQE